MPEVTLYFKWLGTMTLRGFLKIVATEPLIPYYKLSIDYCNHAFRTNLTQPDEVALKPSSWSRNLGRQIPTGSSPANWRDAG